MNQLNRYFFYGSPAKYALVGREDQHIWLVTDNLELAQFISLLFESKITTVVYDLTTFENYTPELIDNSICFNWQIPSNVLANISVLDTRDKQINSMLYNGKELELKNIINHDILLLSVDCCQELQQQLMCLHIICQRVNLDSLVISNRLKEIVSCNLELEQIELKLYNLANELMTTEPSSAISILQTLDRLYE